MRVFLALLLASALNAAVIQGVVLDRETGLPLARTLIQLIPVEGTQARTVTLRSAERGTFAVINVSPGWYILRAARKVYAPAEVGQTRPSRPGRPFQVERDDQSFFLEVRMVHAGAVSGIVVDENNVGLPDWDVQVFSKTGTKTIQRVAQGKSDDRGVFRIGGLDPGNYIVRSGEGELEDGTLLIPTYHKFGTSVEMAEPAAVRYGETTADLRIQPAKGILHSIQGSVAGACDKLTLITESGRRTLSPASFQIDRVPPGRADLLAEGPGYGGILHLNVDRDLFGQVVPCQYLAPLGVLWGFEQGKAGGVRGSLLLRRIDLDGVGEPQAVRSGRITPGRYEITAIPGDPDQYAQSVSLDGRLLQANPDGSFTGEINVRSVVSLAMRSRAPQIGGTVLAEGKPVIGAPVFVELFDRTLPQSGQRLRLWSLRTDVNGKFLLRGLAPGRYRVLSSFDFDPGDLYAMDGAPDAYLKEGDVFQQELKMLP